MEALRIAPSTHTHTHTQKDHLKLGHSDYNVIVLENLTPCG